MKVKFYFMLISIACCNSLLGQSEQYNCLNTAEYQFFNKAAISQSNRETIDTGRNIVFLIRKLYDCTANIYDDQISITANWKIPEGVTNYSFKVSKSDSIDIPFFYIVRQGWNIIEIGKFAEGNIECRLIENKWQVEGDLSIRVYNLDTKDETTKRFTFSETFVRKKLPRTKRK
ncbi:hypothetical protein ACQ33O_02915 [Ferruginibacter sp. SUN002]|uniref:hypothetical protein n=1 Tax=Ferruginibacter sp. SUN002 TaxID=2937789 RepID=UPI003D36EB08